MTLLHRYHANSEKKRERTCAGSKHIEYTYTQNIMSQILNDNLTHIINEKNQTNGKD